MTWFLSLCMPFSINAFVYLLLLMQSNCVVRLSWFMRSCLCLFMYSSLSFCRSCVRGWCLYLCIIYRCSHFDMYLFRCFDSFCLSFCLSFYLSLRRYLSSYLFLYLFVNVFRSLFSYAVYHLSINFLRSLVAPCFSYLLIHLVSYLWMSLFMNSFLDSVVWCLISVVDSVFVWFCLSLFLSCLLWFMPLFMPFVLSVGI